MILDRYSTEAHGWLGSKLLCFRKACGAAGTSLGGIQLTQQNPCWSCDGLVLIGDEASKRHARVQTVNSMFRHSPKLLMKARLSHSSAANSRQCAAVTQCCIMPDLIAVHAVKSSCGTWEGAATVLNLELVCH